MPANVPSHPSRPGFPQHRPKRQVHDHFPGRKSHYTADRRAIAFHKAMLADHPLCEDHLEQGQYVASTEVHHIVRRADDPDGTRWLDPTNVRCLCKICHSRRTARGE